ncbi:MAG: xanthine dehydrogenase molybdopterin binding subunit [Tabrizicola sp.]|uniref:xanthine dehydrogenase molybdopterin binding subunit n=1 Tax=Tabrizicola sp. TaxID=2005166 RepID=UPI0027366DA8|nr:xanthine dehydrogenase molybdopterin binding subunit [Tabrizicola sp.]MDP3262586.1 xanthine dehydrogenase molybdopterin binding subunit [Tabrizicola sp.]MDP3647746.1 xanthine dehydrogenase molybdopterin binding subunit [Paracoccaceae bacterium]
MSMGKPLPHDAAPLHVTGQARYVDDIPLPGNALHLAFGLSTVAHGEITGIDLSAVRSAPGVVAVLSADDLPDMPDCSPSAHDEPLLAVKTVHYVGQPVFLVIAGSHLAARKAARLGKVTYRELPALLTVDEALAAGSRFEQGPVVWAKGDAGRAIAGAAHVVEGSFEVGGQEHFYLEGQVAAALPQEGGDMIVHSSTQHPTEVQHKVAHALHLPMSAVRVEVRRMGGGFGGKESQGNALAIACALAARLTGRPARMRYDRDDDMMITGKRHDLRITYRAGVDAEGRVLGLEFQHLVRCGWSQDLSLPVADRAMLHADNCYHLPHIRIESHRLKTNTQSATAFRGFGGPQGMVGIERVMDHVAHVVGRDALAVRKANFYRAAAPAGASGGDISEQKKLAGGVGEADLTSRGAAGQAGSHVLPPDGPVQTTPYHMPVEDFIGHELVAELERTSDYAARKAAIAAWNEGSPILKRGIALTPVKFGISFTLTWLNQAGALVHVYQDGSIHLNHGGTEMGQGLFQKVAQVTAAVFGVDASLVKITATDTAKVPNTSATAASSGADLNGMAAKAAAETIRGRLAEFIAEKHQVKPASVRFVDGQVRVAGEVYGWAQVVAWAYQARVSLSSTGFYATPKIVWDRVRGTGRPFFYFAYGAAVTEVVIDRLTGENRILRADVLHDTGTSLNPALDIGQVEGAYMQGAGWLTTEELVWDGKGRLATHAPSTYKIPACSDRPRVFNVALWGRPNREDAVGKSKAVGEPPFMLGISVLMALSDAVAACGDGSVYPGLDAPATAERVLAAVRRQHV